MIDIIRNGRFLIHPGSAAVVVFLATIALMLMVAVSRDNSVRTADSSCVVGAVVTSSETIKIQLECAEGGVTTSTSTSQPANVLAIVKSQTPRVTCNVMHNGWARDCQVP